MDTTTASGWRECYSPDHPLTRTESGVWKMKLLGVISHEFKLVCGSETGMEAAVPVCDYFEGMLSLGPYRVPDSGRKMQVIWDEVPERVAKFQVGWKYRLPLWELVFHECCVAQWYWGDYNNKLPAIWDKRDQFNALYATPGMFMFNREQWKKEKDRFVKSYKAWAGIVRSTGYSEMTDHRFSTADRSVQQTSFANGVNVIVNFGDKPFKLKNGKDLEPGGIWSEGVK
ncbi:MAG: glycoside hydrolase [Verrucomicrobiota bacterium]